VLESAILASATCLEIAVPSPPCQESCRDAECWAPSYLSPLKRECTQTCASGSECGSGCCYTLAFLGLRGVCVSADTFCTPTAPATDPDSLDRAPAVTACSSGSILPGEPWANNSDCRGYGDFPRVSACMYLREIGKRCVAECQTGADCQSGCCVPLHPGENVCLPSTYCR
jgi:hypothetical protein